MTGLLNSFILVCGSLLKKTIIRGAFRNTWRCNFHIINGTEICN